MPHLASLDTYASLLGHADPEAIVLSAARVRVLARALGVGYSSDRARQAFEQGAVSSLDRLDIPSDRDQFRAFVTLVHATADLSRADVRDRVMALTSMTGLRDSRAQVIVDDAFENQGVISDISAVAGAGAGSILSDLARNLDVARAAGQYCLEHDPWANTRADRRAKVATAAKVGVPLILGALTLTTGPVGDALLVVAVPIISSLINEEASGKKTIDIFRRLKKEVATQKVA